MVSLIPQKLCIHFGMEGVYVNVEIELYMYTVVVLQPGELFDTEIYSCRFQTYFADTV